MNLLTAPWLPFKRRDGRQDYLPVTAVVDPDIVDLALPRADFHGAAYQFLIGLLQTAMAPEDKEEWVKLYQTPPSMEACREAFAKFQSAFELDSAGPAFMQDFDLLEDESPVDIASLLIDSPGANTIENNVDHFVKSGRVKKMCQDCAAIALFTLQINAPGGGQGHMSGLRGGGPLTTLVMPADLSSPLWRRLWINVLDKDLWGYDEPDEFDASVFPWLSENRSSDKKKITYPDDMHSLHPYWPMPRRIRLEIKKNRCQCDLCGRAQDYSVFCRRKTYGLKYSGAPWIHPLTPYYKDLKNPASHPQPYKAGSDGLTYRHWEALTMEDKKEKGFLPASVVLDYSEKCEKADDMGEDLPCISGLWVFGYEMDKKKVMKAKCWYGNSMPLLAFPGQKRALAQTWLRQMIGLTESSSRLLQAQVKEAWFSRPKDAKGDVSYIGASLWEATEQAFYLNLMELGEALTGETPPQRFPPGVAASWYRTVTRQAASLFDDFALSGPTEQLDMKRITKARNSFRKKLYNGKDAKDFRKIGHLDEGGKPKIAEENKEKSHE